MEEWALGYACVWWVGGSVRGWRVGVSGEEREVVFAWMEKGNCVPEGRRGSLFGLGWVFALGWGTAGAIVRLRWDI